MNGEQFRTLVNQVVAGHRMTRQQAHALGQLLLGSAAEPRAVPEAEPDPGTNADLSEPRALPPELTLPLAALLAALAQRGETAEELCGLAQAMREAATPIPLTDAERARLVDTCGTGGDSLDTFNISTGAALVAASAGAWVAKHGNRAITSRCGSADVLEALGVPIDLTPAAAAACLRATGFVFMLASTLHPALRRVAPVRRALPFRTLFNLAGPLANPAGARAQVLGVPSPGLIAPMAQALQLLGTRHTFVVHGRVAGALDSRGLDEFTTTGTSTYAEVTESHIETQTIQLETFGLSHTSLTDLRGGATAQQNAAILEAILRREDRGPRREIVLLNAGMALVVAGMAASLEEGLAQAAKAVDSGDAAQVLARLRAFKPGDTR